MTSRPNDLDRRSFLRHSALGVVALSLPASMRGDPYAPTLRQAAAVRGPVRIRGIVRGAGRGLGGVAVTDGLSVVDTDGDGRFELVSLSDRDFVSVSLPAGYDIPLNPTGTARFYEPISPNADGEMEVTFDLQRSDRDETEHTLLLLPDIQTQLPWEMARFHAESVPDMVRTIQAQGDRPVFGMSCGDIMYDRLELYPEYERGVQRMGVPFFQVIGNHDLDQENRTDEASTRTFSRHFGPRYYSFDRGAVHYVVLDDVFWHGQGYMGYLDADQLAWLEADLQRVEPGTPVIVSAHIPVVSTLPMRAGAASPQLGTSIANRDALYRLLEPFEAHVLTGHTHENEHRWSHGVHEHVSGTVCGAWWSGDITRDGTPNGYSVYEVRGEEVSWRYKSTGWSDDYQIRAYPAGVDERAPDEFVANVWDWDPGWRVTWYEGADRRGLMARRTGRDPLSVERHLGPDLPAHRSWVDPSPTDHLFYAPGAGSDAEITIEAEDRFGRTYSAAVPRRGSLSG